MAATARFGDEVETLREEGADLVFHVMADAGPAFAARGLELAGFATAAAAE